MKKSLLSLVFLLACTGLPAQPDETNYDESKVPAYVLPPVLETASGEKVTDVETWAAVRRPEILQLFKDHVYGNIPSSNSKVDYWTIDRKEGALDGTAVRDEVVITLSGSGNKIELNLMVYLPNNSAGPVPIFLGLNFYGNHTISPESDVQMSAAWMRNNENFGIRDHRSHNGIRSVRQSRWQVENIIRRGYGLATIYYGDIDPDIHDGFKNGAHSMFESPRDEGSWGSISAWAWGLSRALDYLMTDERIDGDKIAVIGHSRLGKTSLWAGALDPRFALVISNDSGCGGAALSRRAYGETVKRITTSFPHWFSAKFSEYGGKEEKLPVDQHLLIALMAPRPVYVASAVEDRWADPKGEFLAAKHASPAWELYGLNGLPTDEMPGLNSPVTGFVGYHIRSGGHDVTAYDWEQYLDFADRHFRKK